jgi:hypothetical protein
MARFEVVWQAGSEAGQPIFEGDRAMERAVAYARRQAAYIEGHAEGSVALLDPDTLDVDTREPMVLSAYRWRGGTWRAAADARATEAAPPAAAE